MKFIIDDEQKLYAATLDKLLSEADVPGVIRAWAAGSHDAGLSLWRSLAGTGLFALAVPESSGGLGVLPAELVTAFRVLGSHGVPGPYVETAASAALLASLDGSPGGDLGAEWLPRIAEGTALASLTFPQMPYALDADIADLILTVSEGHEVRRGLPGPVRESIDPTRRLFPLTPSGDPVSADAGGAYDLGVLLCAAQLSGLGDRLLTITVDYAKTRRQFGRPIGDFQAVKHHLADAYIALEHARPLLYGAALAFGTASFPRDCSAAKAAVSEAAYLASRIALQVHGAIAYTDEYSPTLLLRKTRALTNAWGSPAAHKSRVLASLPLS